MPHDAHGNLLKVGDAVTLTGKITQIFASEDYCNCSVELDLPMPPDNAKTSISSLNTKQVLLSAVQASADATAN